MITVNSKNENKKTPSQSQLPNKIGAHVSKLKGRTPGRTAQLYVQNIEIEPDWYEEDIIEEVKQHASNQGVHVTNASVVYNKYDEDLVGCRITVPDIDKSRVVGENFWPKPIKCRVWEKNKPQYGDRYPYQII